MIQTSAHEHRIPADNSFDRLLFFSDGVFAIAITLLAIELHPPEDWNGRASDLWTHSWPMFSSFFVSFLVVGVLWNAHRRLFTLVTQFNQGVFFGNLAVLAAIALMPFATGLLYANSRANEGFLIYIGLVGLTGIFQALTYVAAAVSGSARPMPAPRHVLNVLVFALTPAMASSLCILMLTGPILWLPIVCIAAALIALNAARMWARHKYPS